MIINFLDRTGVPEAETKIHSEIQEHFSKSPFTKEWFGYASLTLLERNKNRGDDFDLILFTSTDIICVELKNWHGRKLTRANNHWFVDGRDYGYSPLNRVITNAKKLASAIKEHGIKEKKIPNFKVSALVVLHGNIEDISELGEERENVLTKEEFFALSDCKIYQKRFRDPARQNILDFQKEYDKFFNYSSRVACKSMVIGDYTREYNPSYQHKTKLYTEYIATNKKGLNGLFRCWDFSVHHDLLDRKARCSIAQREQSLYEYVENQNEDLVKNLLRPYNVEDKSEPDLDYRELLLLKDERENLSRLNEFTNKTIKILSINDRISFSKTLLSKLTDLYNIGITHRDLISKNIWLSPGETIRFTGWYLGDFLGSNALNFDDIGSIKYPEGIERLPNKNEGSLKDTFALSAIIFQILTAKQTSIQSFDQKWIDENLPSELTEFKKFFIKGSSKNPSDRFKNVSEMYNEFCNIQTANRALYTAEDLEIFNRKEAFLPEPSSDAIVDGDLEIYNSILPDNLGVTVRRWNLPSSVRRLESTEKAALYQFLSTLDSLKKSQFEGLPKIHDFGILRREVYLIEEPVPDTSIVEWLKQQRSEEELKSIFQKIITTVTNLWSIGSNIGELDISKIYIKDGNPIIKFTYPSSFDEESFEIDDSLLSAKEIDISSLVKTFLNILKINKGPQYLSNKFTSFLEKEVFTSIEVIEDILQPKYSKLKISHETIRIDRLVLPCRMQDEEKLVPFDDGNFKLTVYTNKNSNTDNCNIIIKGKYNQIRFSLDLDDFYHETGFKQKTTPDANFPIIAFSAVRVDLKYLPFGSYEREEAFLLLQKFDLLWNEVSKAINAVQNKKSYFFKPKLNRDIKKLHSSELWELILNAEEESIPSYEVYSTQSVNQNSKKSKVIIKISDDSDISRIDLDDRPFLETRFQEHWKKVGGIISIDTTAALPDTIQVDDSEDSFYAILTVQTSLEDSVFSGQFVRINSAPNIASFKRRQSALRNFINNTTKIPNLFKYFDPQNNIQPIVYGKEESIKIDPKWNFNEDQKNAFRYILTHGPVVLLQGPPGTGKTKFISSLIYYLINENKNTRILLASQSNEAVNNAIEKLLSLQKTLGKPPLTSIVRFGNENRLSDEIINFHEKILEQRFKEAFSSQLKKRILNLSRELGLPDSFIEDVFDVYASLWKLKEKIQAIREPGHPNLEQNRYLEHFKKACAQFLGSEATNEIKPSNVSTIFDKCVKELVSVYEIENISLVYQLRSLIELSLDFSNNIGTPQSRYSEFLMMTRTLVCGTLVGLGRKSYQIQRNTFDWVIIDEASRATASELAIACSLGLKVLLVGDHLQLPPSYSDALRTTFAKKIQVPVQEVDDYLISDFERIFLSHYGQCCGQALVRQYRMHPVIGSLVSQCFYENNLKNGRLSTELPAYEDQLPNFIRSKPVLWIDTSLGKYESHLNSGIRNIDEATAIIRLIKSLAPSIRACFSQEDTEKTIGVICMYTQQKREIRNLVNNDPTLSSIKDRIKVDTVDSYQGKENSIIIVSTVRHNRSKIIGFLKSTSRINVALSRAKDHLIIFGSSRLWKEKIDQPLGKAFKYIQDNNLPVLSIKYNFQ